MLFASIFCSYLLFPTDNCAGGYLSAILLYAATTFPWLALLPRLHLAYHAGLPDFPYFMGDPLLQPLSPASGRPNLPYMGVPIGQIERLVS